tara:strand:- start:208 stop:813 length:606 start_codon:yes stop_codon:yes gene_type:complete
MTKKMIIISSPSGAGKTTICKKILKNNNKIKLSISYTTRPKRTGEVNKKDYNFVSIKQFQNLNKKKFFIETAKVFDHYYGSPHKNIKNAFKNNKYILFDIDWQGAKKLRNKFPKTSIIDFFILPPNKKELRERLVKRGRDNKKEINKRLSLAVSEINHYKEYKYVLVNDNVKKTADFIKKIIEYENILDLIKSKVESINIL